MPLREGLDGEHRHSFDPLAENWNADEILKIEVGFEPTEEFADAIEECTVLEVAAAFENG